MKIRRNSRRLMTLSAALGVSVALGWNAQSQWKLHQLLQHPAARLDARPRSPQQKALWLQQNKRLAQLWFVHQQRDVTPELLALLRQSQDTDIRRRTLRALGRLENPQMLRPLRAWSKTLDATQTQTLRPTLPLALARIQGHDLKTKAKVGALTASVGLKWGQVVQLSKKISAPHSDAHNTPAEEIVEEVVDVFYRDGKQGKSSQSLAKQLVVSPAHQVLLQVAPLTNQQQATFILDYACGSKGEAYGSEYLLETHFPGLGSEAQTLLLKRLQDIMENPTKYPALMKGKGDFSALFGGAAVTRNKQFLPVLAKFENKFSADFQRDNTSSLGWAYFYAAQAKSVLENGA